jgi:hypothetical protein
MTGFVHGRRQGAEQIKEVASGAIPCSCHFYCEGAQIGRRTRAFCDSILTILQPIGARFLSVAHSKGGRRPKTTTHISTGEVFPRICGPATMEIHPAHLLFSLFHTPGTGVPGAAILCPSPLAMLLTGRAIADLPGGLQLTGNETNRTRGFDRSNAGCRRRFFFARPHDAGEKPLLQVRSTRQLGNSCTYQVRAQDNNWSLPTSSAGIRCFLPRSTLEISSHHNIKHISKVRTMKEKKKKKNR